MNNEKPKYSVNSIYEETELTDEEIAQLEEMRKRPASETLLKPKRVPSRAELSLQPITLTEEEAAKINHSKTERQNQKSLVRHCHFMNEKINVVTSELFPVEPGDTIYTIEQQYLNGQPWRTTAPKDVPEEFHQIKHVAVPHTVKVVYERKLEYTQPDSSGYIGTKRDHAFPTKEAAELAIQQLEKINLEEANRTRAFYREEVFTALDQATENDYDMFKMSDEQVAVDLGTYHQPLEGLETELLVPFVREWKKSRDSKR